MKSWFLIPTFKRYVIHKDTNKLYVSSRISCSYTIPVVSVLDLSGGIGRRIPIKKIRTKSIVLTETLRKGDTVMIGYECWKYLNYKQHDNIIEVFMYED